MLGFLKHKGDALEVTVSNRTIIRVLILVTATILGLALLQRISHALTLIFVAFFLSLALNAPVQWIAQKLPGKRRGNRSLATAISFILVMLLLAGFLASIVPPLVHQTNSFIKDAPQLIDNAQNENTALGEFVRKYKLENQAQQFSNQLGERLD